MCKVLEGFEMDDMEPLKGNWKPEDQAYVNGKHGNEPLGDEEEEEFLE